MIKKFVPLFDFKSPTNKLITVDISMESIRVLGEPRRIRAVWTPEMAQDLRAFHDINVETELTNLLSEQIRNEIDRQIIRDLNDNQVFYNQNNLTEAINRWGQIGGNILNHEPDFEHIALPIARRVAAQTIGLDLVPVQPLPLPDLNFLDYRQYYTPLPNEEGWFTNGTFDSLLIKMDMLPFRFIPRRKSRRRRDWRGFTGL